MNIKRMSKMMSLILRHNPGAINATLDENGWLSVETLIKGMNTKGLKINREILDEVVANNDKKRFAFSDDKEKIRASQGHSVKVDVELSEETPPEFLFHGTVDKFMSAIREGGLKKMSRQHVHLSKDRETAVNVGGRRGKPIILTVRTGEMHREGFKFYLSANKVWLTDNVPTEYIEFK